MKVIVFLIYFFAIFKTVSLQSCTLSSQFSSVSSGFDSNHYKLHLTISTIEDCVVHCDISGIENESHTPLPDFKGRNYHYFTFKQLEQGQNYEIICLSLDSQSILSDQTFIYPQNTNDNKVTVFGFGDWSNSGNGNSTVHLLKSMNVTPDAIVFLGDLAYNLQSKNGSVGNLFLEEIRDFTSKMPFQLSMGNHETKHNDWSDYLNRFLLPSKKENKNLYYSYDIKGVHFVALNSEVEFFEEFFPLKEKIVRWLINDLSNSLANWKVVYMHRPLYCSEDSKRCGKEAERLRNLYEDIFNQYNVDLVLTGHLHNYERMYPIYKGQVDQNSISQSTSVYNNPKYPSHLICGTAGATSTNKPYQPSSFSNVVDINYGICQITFDGNTMTSQLLDSINVGNIIDSFQIVKNN